MNITIILFNFRREDPRDAVIFNPKHEGKTLYTLPKGSVIGKLRTHVMAKYWQL